MSLKISSTDLDWLQITMPGTYATGSIQLIAQQTASQVLNNWICETNQPKADLVSSSLPSKLYKKSFRF